MQQERRRIETLYECALTLADTNNDGTTTFEEWRQAYTVRGLPFRDDMLFLQQPSVSDLERLAKNTK